MACAARPLHEYPPGDALRWTHESTSENFSFHNLPSFRAGGSRLSIRDAGELWVVPHPGDQLPAVHAWHVQVHYRESRAGDAVHACERFVAIAAGENNISRVLKAS